MINSKDIAISLKEESDQNYWMKDKSFTSETKI